MTTALDRFERELIHAARALHAHDPARNSIGPVHRVLRRFRRLSLLAQVALVATSASALAGGTVAGLVFLRDSATTKTLANFSCETSRNATEGITAVTGVPTIDCARTWPQATAGRTNAPRLAAWATTTGTLDAVVRPAAWGAPAASHGQHWRRLPDTWTVDLRLVALNDQLADITINPTGTALQPKPCTRTPDAVHAVRTLLQTDGLVRWTVRAQASGRRGLVSGCSSFITFMDPRRHTVELVQLPAARRTQHIPPRLKAIVTAGHLAARKLATLDTRVNHTLNQRCTTVSTAARLWIRAARNAGFTPTTLAFWHAANTLPVLKLPTSFVYHYTLYTQPPQQPGTPCAHILTMILPGSGLPNIYAARITP